MNNKVMMIPRAKLRPPQHDIKLRRKEETIARYEADIRERGIQTPLEVLALSDETFEILNGFTRFKGGERADIELYPCVVLDGPMDEDDKLMHRLKGEEFHTSLDREELALALLELKERKGFSQKRLAQEIGRCESYVTKSLRPFERVPEDIRTALGPGKGRGLYALSTLKDEAKIRELGGKAAAQGWKCERIESEVRKLRGKPARTLKPLEITTPGGLVVRVPRELDYDEVLAELKLAADRVRKGKKIGDDEDNAPVLLSSA